MGFKSWLAAGAAFVTVCAVSGVTAAPSPAPAVAQALRAGAAKIDITPADSTLLAGDMIRDRLYARVIVVENGQSCAVLVGLDLGGANNAIVTDAIARASAASGCPAQNFLISGTHTHSSGSTNATAVANAIVAGVQAARGRLEPVRIGYGTTNVDLNVNRDLFDSEGVWRQAPNPAGHSDKTLAVVEFIGNDNVPVGVYMNYAMHPVNFYLTGVVSADFPGEASRYVESTYGKTVAIFSQGASGDQNPKVSETPYVSRLRQGRGALAQTVGTPVATTASAPVAAGQPGANNPVAVAQQAAAQPINPADIPAHRAAVERLGQWVATQGILIGESAIDVMRNRIPATQTSARIWAGSEDITCPGRTRLDAANPARENVYPGYSDAADITMKVGLLRLGDINFVSVNGEVYSEISARLKKESPMTKTMMVTLANGGAGTGYIYSDAAAHHLSFQVIGSRLKPYCAEDKIVAAGLKLIDDSQR